MIKKTRRTTEYKVSNVLRFGGIHKCESIAALQFLPHKTRVSITKINKKMISTRYAQTLDGILRRKKNVVFFTGAGLSAGAGIPTFRGRFGLWFCTKESCCAGITCAVSTICILFVLIVYEQWKVIQYICFVSVSLLVSLIAVCVLCPKKVVDFVRAHQRAAIWGTWLRGYIWFMYWIHLYRHMRAAGKWIGATHRAMVLLCRAKNGSVYHITQNVDDMSLTAGMPRENVAQLHGSAGWLHCVKSDGPTGHRVCSRMQIRRGTHPLPALGHPWSWKCRVCGSRGNFRPGVDFFGSTRFSPPPGIKQNNQRLVEMTFGHRGTFDALGDTLVARETGDVAALHKKWEDARLRPEETVYIIIGTSGKVSKLWWRLLEFSCTTVIEINPEPVCRALSQKHDYYSLRKKCDDVFSAWIRGDPRRCGTYETQTFL